MLQLSIHIDTYGKVDMIIVKIVEDLLIAEHPTKTNPVTEKINVCFSFKNLSHSPGFLRFYSFNIVQFDKVPITIDADDKLSYLDSSPISLSRRRELQSPLNGFERTAFASINFPFEWLDITCSLFCSKFSNRMQQSAPNAIVANIIKRCNALRFLKKIGPVQNVSRVNDKNPHKLPLLRISDAGRFCETGQLSFLAGLLIENMAKDSVFHVSEWSSNKA